MSFCVLGCVLKDLSAIFLSGFFSLCFLFLLCVASERATSTIWGEPRWVDRGKDNTTYTEVFVQGAWDLAMS